MSPAGAGAVVGCLLGTAVGDALGLWCENLSPCRLRRLAARLDQYHFLCGRGMVSDDTEHACLTAQALIASAGEPRAFSRHLARRLRWWFAGLPAGLGRATLRSCLKLWLGFPGTRSGVVSAGNGAAMRAPVLGICFGHDPARLRDLVRLATRVTHTDPRAEYGALAVALAAHLSAARADPASLPDLFLTGVENLLGADGRNFLGLLRRAAASASAGESPREFAAGLGLHRGITGYTYHTVPVVVQAWLRYPTDYRTAIPAVIDCGGDTDTTAALLGGVLGAGVGKAGIPSAWLAGLWEWPCDVSWMERLGVRLGEVCATGRPQPPLPFSVPLLAARNLVFLAVVLAHVGRRWLPPY